MSEASCWDYATGSVSENVVAARYSEREASTILDRDMNLLSFMEENGALSSRVPKFSVGHCS